jgi:hypothetical protein
VECAGPLIAGVEGDGNRDPTWSAGQRHTKGRTQGGGTGPTPIVESCYL